MVHTWGEWGATRLFKPAPLHFSLLALLVNLISIRIEFPD